MSDRRATTRALEALLIVADQPLDPALLAQLVERPVAEIDELCQELAAGYEVDGRGFVLTRVAGGWRFQSHPELAAYVERYVLEGQSARLSAAALETLAIVAYKQPISRAQIAAIRGVSVDGVMRTLEQRGYIAEIGRDPGPGQAVLFGTTTTFLEKLGLDSLDDLPPLADFVPGPDVVEALEHGLRPEPAEPAEVTDTDEPADTPDDAAVPVAEVTDTDEHVDPLDRLDETTARLDALVEEVRARLEAAEDAVREAEPEPEPEDEADGERVDHG